MKSHKYLLRFTVLLLTVLAVNPAMYAANRKARPTQKEHTAKTVPPTPQEIYQKHVEQEIASLKDDVYTRATWKKLEEVKAEADSNAGSIKLVTFSAGGIGFVLGCVLTFFVARRMGRSDENLKIT